MLDRKIRLWWWWLKKLLWELAGALQFGKKLGFCPNEPDAPRAPFGTKSQLSSGKQTFFIQKSCFCLFCIRPWSISPPLWLGKIPTSETWVMDDHQTQWLPIDNIGSFTDDYRVQFSSFINQLRSAQVTVNVQKMPNDAVIDLSHICSVKVT